MRISVIFISFILISCFWCNAALAVFVKYIDRNGKNHYVNIDYNKIPAEYLDQVQDQLQKIEEQKQLKSKDNKPQNSVSPAGQQGTKVTPDKNTSIDVLVKADCIECSRLEVLLQANKIKYTKHELENSSVGQEFYKKNPDAQFPITKIGKKIIYGNNIYEIKNTLKPKE